MRVGIVECCSAVLVRCTFRVGGQSGGFFDLLALFECLEAGGCSRGGEEAVPVGCQRLSSIAGIVTRAGATQVTRAVLTMATTTVCQFHWPCEDLLTITAPSDIRHSNPMAHECGSLHT